MSTLNPLDRLKQIESQKTNLLQSYSSELIDSNSIVSETIFKTENYSLIKQYAALTENLSAYVGNDLSEKDSQSDLEARLVKANEILTVQESIPNTESTLTPTNNDVMIPSRSAVEYWQQVDQEQDNRKVKHNTYLLRLRNASRAGEIRVEKSGNRITGFNQADLIATVANYNSKNQDSTTSATGLEGRADGNFDGITPEEAMSLYAKTEADDPKIEVNPNHRLYWNSLSARLRYKIKNDKIRTNGEQGKNLRIDKNDLLREISNNPTYSTTSKVTKQKRVKKPKEPKEPSRHKEYTQLRLEGKSRDAVIEEMGLTIRKGTAYEGIFSKYNKDFKAQENIENNQ